MKKIDWGDIATWASTVALVLTFVAILWQLADIHHSIQGDTYQSISEKMIEIDMFFVEKPQLTPYFYSGETLDENISLEEQNRVRAAADMLADFFDDVFYQRELMPQGAFDSYGRWMKEVYSNSPLLREEIRIDAYDEKFIDYLKSGYVDSN